MSKKRVSQVNKEDEARRKAFWEAIVAVEKEHGRQIRPMLNFSPQGIIPYLQDVEHKVEDNKSEDKSDK